MGSFGTFSLITLTAEGRAFGLLAVAGIAARHADVVRITLAVIVEGTGGRLTGYIRGFCGTSTVGGVCGGISPLPEAGTESIPVMSGIAAIHFDILLTAAPVLIINTGYNSTIQIGHCFFLLQIISPIVSGKKGFLCGHKPKTKSIFFQFLRKNRRFYPINTLKMSLKPSQNEGILMVYTQSGRKPGSHLPEKTLNCMQKGQIP